MEIASLGHELTKQRGLIHQPPGDHVKHTVLPLHLAPDFHQTGVDQHAPILFADLRSSHSKTKPVQ